MIFLIHYRELSVYSKSNNYKTYNLLHEESGNQFMVDILKTLFVNLVGLNLCVYYNIYQLKVKKRCKYSYIIITPNTTNATNSIIIHKLINV